MPDPVPPRNPTMNIAASALRAQQSRMRVIAENIANAQSTALVAGGEPYRRQMPVFQTQALDGGTGVFATSQNRYGCEHDIEPGHDRRFWRKSKFPFLQVWWRPESISWV